MIIKTETDLKEKQITLGIDQFINLYEVNNQVDGKIPKTIKWYSEMLRSFTRYLKMKLGVSDLKALSIDMVRGYILYLRQRRRFEGHPYTPEQDTLLSAKTIQCHTKALKAFSSWLYSEGYTTENRLRILSSQKHRIL